MRRPFLITVLLAAAVVATACSDNSSPPLPTQPIQPDLVHPSQSELVTEATALFPTASKLGNLQGQVLAQLDQISAGIAQNSTVSIRDAQHRALLVVLSTVVDYRFGILIGGKSSATQQLGVRFIISVLRFALLPVPPIDPSVLSGDGTVQLCRQSSTSSCKVVVPSNTAGLSIPPGALPSDVLVTIVRLDDAFTPPDPEHRTQYPLVFEVSTIPAVTLPDDNPAIVAVCQYNEGALSPPPSVRSRLVLGHFLADGTVELLPRADGSFLGLCGASTEESPAGFGFNGSRTDSIGWNALRYASDKLTRLLAPAPLYATHSAVAGTIRSFSPVKAVDPGGPAVGSVQMQPDSVVVVVGSTVQFTATPRAADQSDLTGQVPCTWSVDNPPTTVLATVDQNGFVTTVTAGKAIIHASCGGVAGRGVVLILPIR